MRKSVGNSSISLHKKASKKMQTPRNPYLTVDIISSRARHIVMIQRKNPPHGWAPPGGFVDYGETLEAAAVREERGNLARREAGSSICVQRPQDARQHNVTVVYIARPLGGVLAARDDARRAGFSVKIPFLPWYLITQRYKRLFFKEVSH